MHILNESLCADSMILNHFYCVYSEKIINLKSVNKKIKEEKDTDGKNTANEFL